MVKIKQPRLSQMKTVSLFLCLEAPDGKLESFAKPSGSAALQIQFTTQYFQAAVLATIGKRFIDERWII